ncbi:HEPN domain-containing protein [Psychrobacter sp. LV10R520-6]|uniref:HEPN domain-containing protein n=1 Tax=Psychrobacter sp. LV10R520-6 TaxID=1415574 RepID=UPI0024C91F32|nr:HEPN domain-containing protein [Psychrobacter sp. LV10R520-6]SNT71321.1 hypothetical protein SAMN04488491_2555 [Psychrobacter sp. LV10R520-6]
MYRSYKNFEKNLDEVKNLSAVYEYLESNINVPICFDDILRSQLVYSLSALDKLIHDLVKIGIIQIFNGSRPSTPKYSSEPLKMELYHDLLSASDDLFDTGVMTKANIFEKAISEKLKYISYQDPSKISDGLSYICLESQKWKIISQSFSSSERDTKTKLKLIVSRRNSIVHEADIDPQTLEKIPIFKSDCDDTVQFLLECGTAIYELVK